MRGSPVKRILARIASNGRLPNIQQGAAGDDSAEVKMSATNMPPNHAIKNGLTKAKDANVFFRKYYY
jgi:hypothetical protein